ncbi:SRPBCC domain-containing protein [Oricola sp.]|uniref:SRPBCC domain-containing protein n=1 Tax=Oricola sp. TaxID=1979950 RepID=UPI003517687B
MRPPSLRCLIHSAIPAFSNYEARAKIGGKIAWFGSRLFDSTTRKLSGRFFARLKEILENESAAHLG